MLAFTLSQWLLSLGIIVVCVLLILVVLVQQASGGGLVGAFGGGGSGGAFGAKTGDMFTVITVVLAAVFLLLNILGNYAFRPITELSVAPTIAPVPSTLPQPPAGEIPDPANPLPINIEIPTGADTALPTAGDTDKPTAADDEKPAAGDADKPTAADTTRDDSVGEKDDEEPLEPAEGAAPAPGNDNGKADPQ